jgi:IS30 family transposase
MGLKINKMKHITQAQRYEISAYLKIHYKQEKIAELIGVSQAAISKEIDRNKTKNDVYSAKIAQENADFRKVRFKKNRTFTAEIEKNVRQKITEEQWSLEQIVGEAKLRGEKIVSVERIYQCIRADKKNGGTLYRSCRHKLKHRKRPVSAGKSLITNRISIDERPSIISNRERFGDWEMDLIEGKNHQNFILTLVERYTRFMMMTKLDSGKNADGVVKSVVKLLLPYKNVTHSITTDNGKEFAGHEEMCRRLNIIVYFADPYSSWQKGSIENINKLVRQYLPKGTDFDTVSNSDLLKIQYKLNKRPRKILNFVSPLYCFGKFL